MENAIRPGQPWLDTNGQPIQAHGASMFYENGTFYWYGEDKSHTRKKGKIWTWGVRCYSSRDLYNWKDEGHLIAPTPGDKRSILHPNRRLDRPHIIKNAQTGKYVCWLKFNDKAHFAVLTADRFLGPYTVAKDFFQPYGRKCGDFDLAVEEATGAAYLYVEMDHRDVIAARLSEDYTDVSGPCSPVYQGLRPPLSREGVAHFMRGGKHYLLTSGMMGYVPNPSEIAVADDWLGPYAVQGDPHVNDVSSASFNSQVSAVFRHPEKEELYIAMADRWVPDYVMTKEKYDSMLRAITSNYDHSVKATWKERLALMTMPMMGSADTSRAAYVWLPLRFDGDRALIEWKDAWKTEDYQ